jgi:hypothetical protein
VSVRDLRVPVDPIFQAFGVPATVTRPHPDDTPITTTIVWGAWPTEDAVDGFGLQRREPRRVLSIRYDQVPTLPRGSLVDAPEVLGGVTKRWRVDMPERLDPDIGRFVVIPDPDENAVNAEI